MLDLLDLISVPTLPSRYGYMRVSRRESRDAASDDFVNIKTEPDVLFRSPEVDESLLTDESDSELESESYSDVDVDDEADEEDRESSDESLESLEETLESEDTDIRLLFVLVFSSTTIPIYDCSSFSK